MNLETRISKLESSAVDSLPTWTRIIQEPSETPAQKEARADAMGGNVIMVVFVGPVFNAAGELVPLPTK
jgi:hypothetical protein